MKDILFRALANAADGAFITDEDQHIIYWNQAAEGIIGYKYDEIAGKPCYQILDGRDDHGRLICREHCRVAIAALAGRPVTDYDTLVSTKSEGVRWVNMSTLTFPPNSDEASPMLVHLFRDVTQKKRSEQFMHRLLEAAQTLQDEGLSQSDPPESTQHPVTDLTDREREVLSHLAQGFSTRDIARLLSISPATVRNHIRNILQKLQVHSRLEAVVYAFEHGLVVKE